MQNLNEKVSVVFPGLPDPNLENCLNFFHAKGAYVGDGMIMSYPSLNFLNADKEFQAALISNEDKQKACSLMWRLYSACWAAKSCLSLEGDFVDCGTHAGLIANTIANYLNFGAIDKKFYLYDTFDGIPDTYKDSAKFESLNLAEYKEDKLFEKVTTLFKDYQNIDVIKGELPKILEENSPNKISFLNIDLGHYESTKNTFRALYDRVVPGGIIIIHGYGRDQGYDINLLAYDEQIKNIPVLELATGQGIIIKR